MAEEKQKRWQRWLDKATDLFIDLVDNGPPTLEKLARTFDRAENRPPLPQEKPVVKPVAEPVPEPAAEQSPAHTPIPPAPERPPLPYHATERPSAPDNPSFLTPDTSGHLDDTLQHKSEVAATLSTYLLALTGRRAIIPHQVEDETGTEHDNIHFSVNRTKVNTTLTITFDQVENASLERLRGNEASAAYSGQVAGTALSWLMNEPENIRNAAIRGVIQRNEVEDYLPPGPTNGYPRHKAVIELGSAHGLTLTILPAVRPKGDDNAVIAELTEPLARVYLSPQDREWLGAVGRKRLGTSQDRSSPMASDGPLSTGGSGWER